MNTSEKLCLQWNDFKDNTSSSFGELREDRDLTDVTLACEDGQQVEAHKVILAASSPFFKDFLKRNKHNHPLIYMRGLKSEILLAIIDFLYFWEANVFQEDLDSFLALAEELRLKGLSGTDNAKESSFENASKPMQKDTSSSANLFNQISANPDSRTVAMTDNKVIVEVEDLDKQIKSMMTTTDVRSADGKGFMTSCNICGKQLPSRNMPKHIEANHITGVKHACNICGKTSRSRNALKFHNYAYHKTTYYLKMENLQEF